MKPKLKMKNKNNKWWDWDAFWLGCLMGLIGGGRNR